jgi:uncharacterized protein YcfJ
MKRAALLLVPALFLCVGTGPAEARGKAFCRQYAEDVANRRANAGDVLAGTAMGAFTGAMIGLAIDGGRGAGRGALIGGVGGTMLGGIGTNEKWRRVYRRAYRECRAS